MNVFVFDSLVCDRVYENRQHNTHETAVSCEAQSLNCATVRERTNKNKQEQINREGTHRICARINMDSLRSSTTHVCECIVHVSCFAFVLSQRSQTNRQLYSVQTVAQLLLQIVAAVGIRKRVSRVRQIFVLHIVCCHLLLVWNSCGWIVHCQRVFRKVWIFSVSIWMENYWKIPLKYQSKIQLHRLKIHVQTCEYKQYIGEPIQNVSIFHSKNMFVDGHWINWNGIH